MKLKQYIAALQEIADKHSDLTVIYASDSEGNYFNEVYYTPSVCRFDNGSVSQAEEDEENPNAIIIN
jgi:hypothetical protein